MQSTYANEYVLINSLDGVEFDFQEGQPGVVIQFRSSDLNSCSITLAKADVKSGFSAAVSALGEGKFDITCLTDNGLFSLSPIVETSAKLELKDEKGLVIHLDFNLYNPRAKTYLKREGIRLELNP